MLKKRLKLTVFLFVVGILCMPIIVLAGDYDFPDMGIQSGQMNAGSFYNASLRSLYIPNLVAPRQIAFFSMSVDSAINKCESLLEDVEFLLNIHSDFSAAELKVLEAYDILYALLEDNSVSLEVKESNAVVSCNGKVGSYLIVLGKNHAESEDFSGAIDLFKKAEILGKDINDYTIIKCYQGLAEQAYGQGDIGETKTYYEQIITDYENAAINNYDDGFLLKIELGETYYYLGDFEKALNAFNEAERYQTMRDGGLSAVYDTDKITLYLFRSLSYKQEEDSSAALDDFKLVIDEVSVEGKFSDVVIPGIWNDAIMEYLVEKNKFLYREEDISATEELLMSDSSQNHIKELISSNSGLDGGGCFISNLDSAESKFKIAMASKPQSSQYELTMQYLNYFSKLTKRSSFDGFTIQNDPAYQKIITLGEAAIPALKDTITNDDMPYQVRKAAAWLIPDICKSIGNKTLDFKSVQKIAKDAVTFLNKFKKAKASDYSDDILMLMPQIDAVIYTLQK
jgi:tetratricopeptide (TPR) repeat protein